MYLTLAAVSAHAQEATPTTARPVSADEQKYYVKRDGRFTVCSDSRSDAERGAADLDRLRRWICKRWGLPLNDLSSECRVFLMSTSFVLSKDFRLDSARAELRKDENNRDVYAVYASRADYADGLPFFVTGIVLKDMERTYRTTFGHWAYRGMGTLDCSYVRIREKMGAVRPRLAKDEPVFFTESLLGLTEEQWEKQSPELRALYDGEAAALCLTLYREFGRARFVEFLGSKCSEKDLERVFGVKSYDVLDPVFKKRLLRLAGSADNRDFSLP